MPTMTDMRKQAVTGLTPPQLGEAMIRQVYPSVTAYAGIATLGRVMMKTRILGPLSWPILALPYFMKVLPVVGRKYALTNRRLMIRQGWSGKSIKEVLLAEIDEVRIKEDDNSPFYRSATLEIISKGAVAMTILGVPGPEAFRQAILNACKAWVPGNASKGQFIPASAAKAK